MIYVGDVPFIERCTKMLQSEELPSNDEVMSLVYLYYNKPGNEAGGSLHIVLDDGNEEDSSVDFCIGLALERGDYDGVALGAVLRRMSQDQRRRLGRE